MKLHGGMEREGVLELYLSSNHGSEVTGYVTSATTFSLCEHQFTHLEMK